MLTCVVFFFCYGSVSVPFQVRAVEMIEFWLRILKRNSMTFVFNLKIYVSLKTHSPLKSVMLQRNYNFN